MSDIWRRVAARPLPAFALALATLVVLFLGQALWPGPDMALGGHDMRALFYPWLSLTKSALGDGRLPFWHADQFAGYPFLSNPQVAFFYPPTWLALILPVRVGVAAHVAFHLWLAGMGMFLLVRALHGEGLGPWLAGLAFAFSGFASVRVWAGHIGLLATLAWTPWLLWGLLWSVRRRAWWTAVLAGAPFGLAILAGHTTSLLYVGLIWGGWAIFLVVIGDWRLESEVSNRQSLITNFRFVTRQFLIAVAVGLLLSAVQLLPLAQFSLVSSRAAAPSFEFAAAYSWPPAHLVTLLAPEFFGEPLRAGYWSVPNFEELTYYAGALPLLALLWLWPRRPRTTYFYTAILALGVLLALGSYGFLYRFLYEWLPPFRLARAPGRAAFLYVFAAAGLLGDAVAAWRGSGERLRKWARWTLGGTAVAGLAVLAATGAVFAAQHPSDTSGRLWHQLGGWSLALLWLLLGGGLLFRYLRESRPARRRWLGVGIALVLLADLWTFGYKFIQVESMAPAPLWENAAAVISRPAGRVLPWGVSIFEQNGAWRQGLASIFGYNALEVGANQALAASIPDPRSTAYDILGAAYVVAGTSLEQFAEGERPLRLLGQEGNAWVYERERPLPLARLVYDYEVIPDEDAAIARVHQPDFDPATTAILAEAPACDLPETAGEGTVQITARDDGFWRIETDNSAPALLVLSETAYPGWQVMIEGERAEWQTAYTAVRAVCVPAGEHTVTWRFLPWIYAWGGMVSLLGLGLVGTAAARTRRSAYER